MTKNNDKKVTKKCPLTFNSHSYGSDRRNESTDCIEDLCGWWTDEECVELAKVKFNKEFINYWLRIHPPQKCVAF